MAHFNGLKCLLVLILFTSGNAHAEEIVEVGEVLTPRSSETSLPFAAAFAEETTSMVAFTLRSSKVTVDVRTTRLAEIDTPALRSGTPIASEVARYELSRVVITLVDGDHSGWLGYHPRSGTTVIRGAAWIHADLETVMGNSPDPERGTHPERPAYSREMLAPHLVAEVDAPWSVTGAGSIKIEGADLEIDAAENHTFLTTGITRSEAPGVRDRTETWVTLSFDDAEWEAEIPGTKLAADRALVNIPDAARLTGASPTHDVLVEGPSQIELRPSALSPRQMSLAFTKLPANGSTHRAPLESVGLLIVGAIAVGVAGGGAFAALRGRRLAPEDALALARLAQDRGDLHGARRAVRRAKRSTHLEAQVRMEEAFIEGEAGNIERAISLYADVSARTTSGEADLDAALLLLRSSGIAGPRAQALLVRALTRSPELVIELEGEHDWVVGDELREAVQAAYERLGE